jgi:hypothetical protein
MAKTIINGWVFNSNFGNDKIHIVDDKMVLHYASIVGNDNRILIEKTGTSRILKYPKFVLDYTLEEFQRIRNKNDLVLVNEPRIR